MDLLSTKICLILDKYYKIDLQRLEHWWLVYHGCFELFLESLRSHCCRYRIILHHFPFYIENSILCVLIRIASMRWFKSAHTTYLHVKANRKYILIMPPDLALWLTHISSNQPCLEYIFMVPKVFEPLKLTLTTSFICSEKLFQLRFNISLPPA